MNILDLEAILGYHTVDVVFTSSLAEGSVEVSPGVIRERTALRARGSERLPGEPDLLSKLQLLHTGVGTLVICYPSPTRPLVSDVLRFRNGKVCKGYAMNLTDGPTLAGRNPWASLHRRRPTGSRHLTGG